MNEKAYIFGGAGPSEVLTLLDNTQIYDFETDTWSSGADMLEASSALSAEFVDGKMYIFGENVVPHALTTVKVYDPVGDTWTEKGFAPEIFYAQGSCVYDGLIYAFGGRDLGFNLINRARSYDPETDTWTELTDMPYERDKSAVCVYEDEIYLFGGNPSPKYSPETDSWTELNTGTCEIVAYATPIVYGDKIFLLGGYKDEGTYPNPCNEIWVYLPAQDTLVKSNNVMPFNRFTRGHKYEHFVYLFGGHYNNTLGSVTNEVWRGDLDFISSINEIEHVTSEEFILYQNHPNPFSGSTVITYELLEPALISIEIFDVLGKKVACPMNEFQGIGKHEIEWESNGMNPGIYFIAMSNGMTRQHIMVNIAK